MDRAVAESFNQWTIRDYARSLPPAEASALFQRLTKSTACAYLFQQILLHEENEELARIKDFLEQNPLRFDPNPWDYLPVPELEHPPVANIHSYTDGSSAFWEKPKKNLSSLPTEVLLKIGERLPAATNASLALVNKDLHHRLGDEYHSRAIRQDWRERFEFLQLLERDTNAMVACPRCISLHVWRKNDCEFRWWKSNSKGIPHKFPYIPRFYLRLQNYLDYGFARTIGRLSVKFGPDSFQCHEALRMATPKLKSLWFPTVRASRSISNRIVDGNLISRSQIAISPYSTSGTLTNEAFRILTTALTAPQFQICDHIDFPMFLQYLDAMASQPAADPDQDQYPNDYSISEADRWGTDGVVLQDNYTYYRSNQDGLGVLGQSGPDHQAREIPQQFYDQILSPGLLRLFDRTIRGQVRSCSQCTTDFGLGVQYVPDVGKALVMAIWRDVGGPCQKGEDELRGARKWRWDSHRCDRYHYRLLHQTVDSRRLIQAMSGLGTAGTSNRGAIFKSFEAAETEEAPENLSATDFSPELCAENISALQQKDASSSVSFDEFFGLDDYMARDRASRPQGQLLEGVECAESVGQALQDGNSTGKCLLSE